MKINIQIPTRNQILSAALVIILATGCEKRLDILPYQSITADKALESESDVNVTLIGAYDGAQNAAKQEHGSLLIIQSIVVTMCCLLLTR